MWHVISKDFKAVPDRLVWDHEAGIGKAKLCESVAAFAGALGCKIIQTPPRDPEFKGIVERTNGYMKRSFSQGVVLAILSMCKPSSTSGFPP